MTKALTFKEQFANDMKIQYDEMKLDHLKMQQMLKVDQDQVTSLKTMIKLY